MKEVPKGWGWERWIINNEEYCGKLLFFKKDKKSSWHYHILKDEVFYVQSGIIIVKYSSADKIEEADQIILQAGEAFHIARGLRHQIMAIHETELFEFSTQHFDSDSYRIIKGD
jgi:quercetin dioxygenase-like cupin family protein